METYRLDISDKNIPIPPKSVYEKQLLAKTGDVVERLRWKSFFHFHPQAQLEVTNSYGFKTDKAAPQVKELNAFERELFDVVTNVKYKQHSNNAFQNQLSKKVREINKSDKVFLMADKTTNIYKVSKDDYNKLLKENITKDYTRTSEQTVHTCNQEASKIAHTLKLDRRIEAHSENNAYITLKDHKPDFRDRPKCRLINPAKTQIGRISKQLLEKLNKQIREKTGLQQWRSTSDALDWFNKIESKQNKKFLQLDIVEFYPSITENLLDKAFNFAEQALHAPIDKQTIEIVKHSRQSFLFSHNQTNPEAPCPWVKNSGQFDVTMGAPDGAEVCELVGLFLINEVKGRFPELNFGLYRDDGLAAHNRIPNRRLDRIRKDLHALFGEHSLRITVETDKTTTDFLDVTLDLTENTHAPYRKPNDTPLYVHVDSNHPPNVINQIPKSINARLSSISCNRETFDRAAPAYQQALENSGHNYTLTYTNNVQARNQTNQATKDRKKKKKRQIIWFNPPYNKAVQTNIGKCFLALLDKHFPPQHPLRKVINRNCVKISYSCTKNMKTIIQAHNAKILRGDRGTDNTTPKQPVEACNCKPRSKCVVNNQCKSGPVIYKATVAAGTQEEKTYVGCTNDFKHRHSNHKNSFRDISKKHATVLSQHVWNKGLAPNPDITWEIVAHAQEYKKGNRYCDLCITEKLQIAKELKKPTCLNKRTDLTNFCVHKAAHKLSKIKT